MNFFPNVSEKIPIQNFNKMRPLAKYTLLVMM